MKMVYAVSRDTYRDINHIGVRNKVEGMRKCFKENGISSTLHEYEWKGGYPMIEVSDDTDILYFRRIDFSFKLLKKLAELKSKSKHMRIIMEIPTYPFEGEKKGKGSLKVHINRWIGETFGRFLIDRIVMVGQKDKRKKIYGIPVIHIQNGVDYEAISPHAEYGQIISNEIHMIAVSGCYFWHGYDRLIKGLANYYSNDDNTRKVYLHMVGSGECLSEYQKLAEEKGLLNHYVFFRGVLQGKALDEEYDLCDIAVDCLGCHRKGLYYVSSLKVREYAAKGLPIVTSTEADLYIDELKNYFLVLPPDETDIKVEEIIQFYDKLNSEKDRNSLSEQIRQEFRKHCEWKYTLRDLLQFITAEK